jgi:DNA-binding MarR family transcriptional regulator
LLGPYGQLVRLKPGENKTKTNMNDAQLKLSSQICFPLYSASLITKAYKPYLDEITYPQYLVLLVLWKRWTFVNQITEKLLLNTLSPLLKRMEKMNPTTHSFY